jgi:ABC-type glycerol-3-phosphate transport system permease component
VTVAVAARRRRASPAGMGLRYGPVAVAAAVFGLPVFWVLVVSLKKQSEYASALFPSDLHWLNYELAVTLADVGRFAVNSLFLSGAYAVLAVLASALVGYGFARHQGPGRNKLFVLVLATWMVPNLVLFVPQFVMFARLGLTNTYWPWILWGLSGSPFAIFLFRQFFATFPRELDDAAEVDGAGPLRIFLQIYLPNAGPALAATAIFMFLWVWGDWLYPALLLHQDNTTLAVRMANAYVDPRGNPLQTVTMAGVVLYVLPLILFFAFAQRFIVRGIVTTGIKG